MKIARVCILTLTAFLAGALLVAAPVALADDLPDLDPGGDGSGQDPPLPIDPFANPAGFEELLAQAGAWLVQVASL